MIRRKDDSGVNFQQRNDGNVQTDKPVQSLSAGSGEVLLQFCTDVTVARNTQPSPLPQRRCLEKRESHDDMASLATVSR